MIDGLGIVVLGVALLCGVGAFAAFGTARRVEAGALGIAVVLLSAGGVTLLTHHGSRAQVLTSTSPTDAPTEGYPTDDSGDGSTGAPSPGTHTSARPSGSPTAASSSSPSGSASAQAAATTAASSSPAAGVPHVTTSPAPRRPSAPATSGTSPKPSPKPSPSASPKPSPTPSPTPPPPPPSRGDFSASATANPTCDSGGHAHPGAFQISNTTSSNIAWTARAVEKAGKGPWASVGPNKGTTNAGKTTSVSVKPVDSLCKRGAGSTTDHVEISYSGGTLTVWFTVTPYS